MAAAAPAQNVTCPSCHASVPSSSKFCPGCGAALAPPPSAPAIGATPSAPVDLRESVDQSRGTLKRLELLIPGYHGYRQADDIRAADSLLRRQIADRLKNARTTAETARTVLTTAGQFAALNDLAPLVSDLMRLEPKVRSAEQGYSGIATAIKVGPQQLDRLYEYDYGFAIAADQFGQTMSQLPALASAGNPASLQALIATARSQLNDFDQAFQARMRAVEGIQVQ